MVNFIVDITIKDTMIKRSMIERTCEICRITTSVRKDGAGTACRSCRARVNHKIRKPKDMLGKKFGRLTAIKSMGPKPSIFFWLCKCDCGKEVEINGNRLRSGHTKSCGCITATQKGLSTSKTYNSWSGMMSRCYDKNDVNYKRYGGSGIIVCDSWHIFENFYKDMGDRPDKLSIDRINFIGNYEPDNCRWATIKQQNSNRSDNHILDAFGIRMTLAQWSEKTGIGTSTIWKRIVKLKWFTEKALTIKPRNYYGKSKSKTKNKSSKEKEA